MPSNRHLWLMLSFDFDIARANVCVSSSFLNNGVRILLSDERADHDVNADGETEVKAKRIEFYYEGGVRKAFVEYINRTKTCTCTRQIFLMR